MALEQQLQKVLEEVDHTLSAMNMPGVPDEVLKTRLEELQPALKQAINLFGIATALQEAATGYEHRGKPYLCLDFDGVCNSYQSGWQGLEQIPDGPVPGLFEFISEAAEHFIVAVYSSRSRWENGRVTMAAWFQHHYDEWVDQLPAEQMAVQRLISIFDLIELSEHKPPAKVALDDRVLTFMGVWPSINELKRFQPWTKGQDDLTGYEDLVNGG